MDRESTAGPLMSKRFAERLGYDISYLGMSRCVPVHAIQSRPGGWEAVSFRDHRTEYQVVWCIWVDMNLAREGETPRRVQVRFLIFEDGTMPAEISVEFVLDSSFADAYKDWLCDAAHSDVISRCFFQSGDNTGLFIPQPTAQGGTTTMHAAGARASTQANLRTPDQRSVPRDGTWQEFGFPVKIPDHVQLFPRVGVHFPRLNVLRHEFVPSFGEQAQKPRSYERSPDDPPGGSLNFSFSGIAPP